MRLKWSATKMKLDKIDGLAGNRSVAVVKRKNNEMLCKILILCCLASPLVAEARRRMDHTIFRPPITPTLPPCNYNEEMLECGPPCDTECATLGQPCDIVNKRCMEGCYCVDGYARNSLWQCVPYDQCP